MTDLALRNPTYLDQLPTEVCIPMTVYKMRECSPTVESERMMDSLMRVPDPTITFSPMLTFGPS